MGEFWIPGLNLFTETLICETIFQKMGLGLTAITVRFTGSVDKSGGTELRLAHQFYFGDDLVRPCGDYVFDGYRGAFCPDSDPGIYSKTFVTYSILPWTGRHHSTGSLVATSR